MTVIAVKHRGKGIFDLAAGTQVTVGRRYKELTVEKSERGIKTNGKIFEYEGFILACAGKMAHAFLLQKYLKKEQPIMTNEDLIDWLVGFRKYLKKKTDKTYESIEIDIVIIGEGKCFFINEYVCPKQITEHYALGSGWAFALGALDKGATVKEAVQIASKHDLFCSGEITTSTNKKQK